MLEKPESAMQNKEAGDIGHIGGKRRQKNKKKNKQNKKPKTKTKQNSAKRNAA